MEKYLLYIIFFHILSAIIWVGGMIAIRFAVHPSLQNIKDEQIRVARILEITSRLFVLVMPFIITLLITGLMLASIYGLRGKTDLSMVVHIKETIWLIMTINYGFMLYLRYKAQLSYLSNDLMNAKKLLSNIAKYLLPINIFLGILALYFGLILRGF